MNSTKTALIALGALALSSTAVLARDVYSTAPDNDELSHVTQTQQQEIGDYKFNPASARNVITSTQSANGDAATQPDFDD